MQPAAAWAGHGFISIGVVARLRFGNPNLDVGTRPGAEDRDVGHRATLRLQGAAALICLKRRRFSRAFLDLHLPLGRRPIFQAALPSHVWLGVQPPVHRENLALLRKRAARGGGGEGSHAPQAKMNHRGVDFTVAPDREPNVWRWQFRIDDKVTTGKTETALRGIAARRAQIKIDEELRNSRGSRP
jgi:hypothetical protein